MLTCGTQKPTSLSWLDYGGLVMGIGGFLVGGERGLRTSRRGWKPYEKILPEALLATGIGLGSSIAFRIMPEPKPNQWPLLYYGLKAAGTFAFGYGAAELMAAGRFLLD